MVMMICCMGLASDSQDPFLSLAKTRPWGWFGHKRIVRSSYINPTVSRRGSEREREREREIARDSALPRRRDGMI
jgi:hypothetical protein